MLLFMNIGSRFVEIKFTKGQEMILKNIAREVMIFVIAFMGSRDFLTALLITTCFIILRLIKLGGGQMPNHHKEFLNVCFLLF